MLKTVFIGSRNDFDEVLVHWLAQRTHLVGVVWTNAASWRKTRKQRLQFVQRRLRRYGLLKVLDEILFYYYYRRYFLRGDMEALRQQVIEPYQAQHGRVQWEGDAITAVNVNSPEVLAFLEERAPDVVFAMCINSYFGKKLRAIPRLGTFLWHEGVTPEYKGLQSPFWAVHNLEFDRIGYTLLRMNDELDAGEIFVQGKAEGVDPIRHGHGFMGHKAIADSLPAVEQFLSELESGTARPVDRADAQSGYYTYAGISDLIRQRLRLRRLLRGQADHVNIN